MNEDNFLNRIKDVLTSRLFYVSLAFLFLSVLLIFRLYNLQIVKGVTKKGSEEYYTVKYRYIPATRGLIYDKNGVLLAGNELSYSVFLEQSANLSGNAQKNEMILKLCNILRSHGVAPEFAFCIEEDPNGKLVFNVSGNAELRFKKNAYGLRSVNNLSENQRNATAEEVFDFLCHGDKTSAMFGISDDLTMRERLDIAAVRYAYFTTPDNSTRYTVATNIDTETIAALMEASGELPGVSVEQQTKRIYHYSKYFAHIIGYTGLINEEELEKLSSDSEEKNYTSTDYIGKTGIEAAYENILSGVKGVEKVTLNRSGRIIGTEMISEPVPGQNVYLSLDAKLQKEYFYLLEKNIASVLASNIVKTLDYGTKGESSDDINIPIYECYYALFANHVINIDKLSEDNVSLNEKQVNALYISFRESMMQALRVYTKYGNTQLSSSLSENVQKYLAYLYSEMKEHKFITASKIDTSDPVYVAYDYDQISFYEYIEHCINKEWVDLEALGIEGKYYTTKEVYETLMEMTFDAIFDSESFSLMIFHDLIFSYNLTGREICLLLFDQSVIEYNEEDYRKLINFEIAPYDFFVDKIKKVKITPAMLAIEPYNGAVVQTDCKTGEVIAMVTYPSYDNNLLANKIDWDYYSQLLGDASNPLYNRATQMRIPTGSTIKPLVAVAGILNEVLTSTEKIQDEVIFTKIDPSPSCWYTKGHGAQTLAYAIRNSCNYYFYEVGYRLATKGLEKYSDSQGITLLNETGALFGLTENSGVEISEAEPAFSDSDAVRSSIGYGHKFTVTQLSRYATAIATSGNVYKLTMISKITDKDGNCLYASVPEISRQIEGLSDNDWSAIHNGMEMVISSSNTLKKAFSKIPYKVAAKTGTAEVSDNNAAHALTVSFAPSSDPETSVVAVITNGYSGTNAAILVSDIYKDYYHIVDDTDLGEIEFIGD
ncbi:MAG: hypothetical protein K6F63_02790 [Lachnospiraceae bacterium]|nr:hypothetical protein [Lachnospiraceae bacterium]